MNFAFYLVFFRVLQTLFVIVDELRSGADHCIHIVFRAIVGILAVVDAERKRGLVAGEADSSIGSGPGLLKKLRKECLRCLVKMCSVFPASMLSETERRVLMDVAVWPEVCWFCVFSTLTWLFFSFFIKIFSLVGFFSIDCTEL